MNRVLVGAARSIKDAAEFLPHQSSLFQKWNHLLRVHLQQQVEGTFKILSAKWILNG
jgi:hypothetical protein